MARKVARKQKYITKEKNMKYLIVVAHPDDEVARQQLPDDLKKALPSTDEIEAGLNRM